MNVFIRMKEIESKYLLNPETSEETKDCYREVAQTFVRILEGLDATFKKIYDEKGAEQRS